MGTLSPVLAGLSFIGALLGQDTVHMTLLLLSSQLSGPRCLSVALKRQALCLCCSSAMSALPHSPLDVFPLVKRPPHFLQWLFWIVSSMVGEMLTSLLFLVSCESRTSKFICRNLGQCAHQSWVMDAAVRTVSLQTGAVRQPLTSSGYTTRAGICSASYSVATSPLPEGSIYSVLMYVC